MTSNQTLGFTSERIEISHIWNSDFNYLRSTVLISLWSDSPDPFLTNSHFTTSSLLILSFHLKMIGRLDKKSGLIRWLTGIRIFELIASLPHLSYPSTQKWSNGCGYSRSKSTVDNDCGTTTYEWFNFPFNIRNLSLSSMACRFDGHDPPKILKLAVTHMTFIRYMRQSTPSISLIERLLTLLTFSCAMVDFSIFP